MARATLYVSRIRLLPRVSLPRPFPFRIFNVYTRSIAAQRHASLLTNPGILYVKYVLRQYIYIDAYFAQSPRDSVPYIPEDTYQDFHPYASCKSGFPFA